MPIKVDLLRSDDLLSLRIEGENLALDASDPADPVIVVENSNLAAFLIVTFPPQTIVEEAFYESSPLKPPKGEENKPLNTTLPPVTPPTLPARSRIGGPSRLVFRIPPGANVRIPYTVEGLLQWNQLALHVSALANVPAAPTAAERQQAPAIAPPGRLDTAIELPYRLVLSPNSSAVWRHATAPKTHLGLTELWHTRMAQQAANGDVTDLSRAQPAPLRAIWSPDYNPNKFTADDAPQFMKPDADWGVLTAMNPSDRHEIVVLTSGFHGYVKDKDDFRAYEPSPVQAEQLILSPLGGWLRSRGNWDPPATFRSFFRPRVVDRAHWDLHIQDFSRLRIRRVGDPDADPSAEPEASPSGSPGDAQPEVAGGTAGAAAADAPIALPADISDLVLQAQVLDLSAVLWPGRLGYTGTLLNLSEWSHIATQGRDHYVRIVYEGHLYPLGNRASLIKVTERKIRDVPGPNGVNTPVAYLVQRMFIVVRQPLRDYTVPEVKSQLQNGGRGLPFRRIRLTTLVTPDIARPEDGSLLAGTTYSFWVRLGQGTSASDDFKFHAIGEDVAGNSVDLTMSLVFVPFGEGHRDKVASEYNLSGESRACIVPGQKVTYAPGAGTENTALTTSKVYFATHTAPENKTFGGFLPKLFKASVKLPAVEAIVGVPAETEIAFDTRFLTNDPGNASGLFAKVVKETSSGVLEDSKLGSSFSADKAGGFATPNLSITGLTQKFGPLAGDLTKVANDTFDPTDFFKDTKDAAKLFGTLPLTDLLKPLTMAAGAPAMQMTKESLPAAPPVVAKFKVVGTLDWKPEVGPLTIGIVSFHPEKNGVAAKLEVKGRVEKIVEIPPPPQPDPGTATMEGSLTNFRLELLQVVEVLFDRFTFTARTGQKLDVGVALDPDTPVRFIGDLNFVEEIRKAIPPDLFGDGPSLDISLARIKAGFTIALPPVSVGVFSLRDMTLGAFIELPFVDGKPVFDFSFCTRERPFNLTVMIFGGGGFFHLQIDAQGLKMLEAALEFGASCSIDLGVASGGVYIMAGIYFSMERKTIEGKEVDAATLGGYLRLGGELSVLGIISVSLEFYLIFAYEFAKNAAYGRATLTVKVEVLFFSASVEVTVEKRFGGSAGDPNFLEGFETPAVWEEYAGAFA